jgi:hypothetical protein
MTRKAAQFSSDQNDKINHSLKIHFTIKSYIFMSLSVGGDCLCNSKVDSHSVGM